MLYNKYNTLLVQPILSKLFLAKSVICHNQNPANTTVTSQTVIYDAQNQHT